VKIKIMYVIAYNGSGMSSAGHFLLITTYVPAPPNVINCTFPHYFIPIVSTSFIFL